MKNNQSKFASIITKIILTLLGAFYLYPFAWMIITALKTQKDAALHMGSLWPTEGFHFENLAEVWVRLNFFKYFWNTLAMAVGTVVLVVLIYTMAGFAFAKLRFKGNNFIFLFFLSMMFVPGMTVTIPLAILINSMGLGNTYLGLILPGVNGAGPFAMLLFRNYFKTISSELIESGVIDGAGYFRIYLQIFLPLALPAIATIAIMNFMGNWNSFMWPSIVLTDKARYVLSIALRYLDNAGFKNWPHLMCGALFNVVPTVIAFFAMQRYYLEGVTAGAIKF